MITLVCCYSGREYTCVFNSMHHWACLSLHTHVSWRCLLENEYRLHENGKRMQQLLQGWPRWFGIFPEIYAFIYQEDVSMMVTSFCPSTTLLVRNREENSPRPGVPRAPSALSFLTLTHVSSLSLAFKTPNNPEKFSQKMGYWRRNGGSWILICLHYSLDKKYP